jgi:hypothetical protein
MLKTFARLNRFSALKVATLKVATTALLLMSDGRSSGLASAFSV